MRASPVTVSGKGTLSVPTDSTLSGAGYLDCGDTPAVKGMFEAASCVVGSGLDSLLHCIGGEHPRIFVPIAGLHHAGRNSAAGFCVFNDPGVLIETLRQEYAIRRVAYIDIDAHHGDGVFYAFEADPDLIFADIHEDGRIIAMGGGGYNRTNLGLAWSAVLESMLEIR